MTSTDASANPDTSAAAPIPHYVYKILSSAPPLPLPPALPVTPFDAQDGRVHLSSAAQTPHTAALIFAADARAWLLKIDTARVRSDDEQGGDFVWAPGAPGCVHLYGRENGRGEGEAEGERERRIARLGGEVVVDVKEVARRESEGWESAMEGLTKEGWLVDQ